MDFKFKEKICNNIDKKNVEKEEFKIEQMVNLKNIKIEMKSI